jgi:transposase InsO family protein
MPWRETKPMDERLRLISDWTGGCYTVTELSVIYGVSRKTVYKWTTRYDEHGIDGLKELCRAPRTHPNRTDDAIIERLVRAKLEHMNWGPKKLLYILKDRGPEVVWPSAGTAEKWLKRSGLVKKRRYRKHVPPYSEPFLDCDAANKVWSADFKGRFRTGDGLWCYPLTVSDNMSRYLLSCRGLYSPGYDGARTWFEWAFREYGVPEALRTDNGTPFAGHGVTGLSRLSVWWIKLGIRPERIEVGKPQHNGRHERMHRTLKEETVNPPAADMGAQQAQFDEFRRQYNDMRPHEALGQRPPASVYETSDRRYPEKIRDPEYDEGVNVRLVKQSGEIMFKGNRYYLTELLAGERVGLVEVADGCHEIRFGLHPIGVLALKLGKIRPKTISRKVLPMSVG